MKNIINNFKNLDNLTYKIMKYGFKVCFGICIISVLILLTYETKSFSSDLYYIGLSLFKLSLIFGIEFVICGIVVDYIKKAI